MRLILFLISVIALIGCDKSVDPFDVENTGGGGTLNPGAQRVLLEDLTGFRCNNCPAAADQAENLVEIYGEQLIVVGIHSSDVFSTPNPPGSADFTTDYRTVAGSAYHQAYNNPSLPTGMVNRREFDGSATQAFSAWPQRVEEIIQETAKAAIALENITYNTASREVTFDVSMATAEGLEPGTYFMTLYLTEDSIVDWQAFPGGVNQPDYLHRHVLRDNINGTWGDEAFNSADPGQENTLSYQYTLDDAWVEERCEIIAYIYHSDTREIVQVDSHYVMGE